MQKDETAKKPENDREAQIRKTGATARYYAHRLTDGAPDELIQSASATAAGVVAALAAMAEQKTR